jgi:hypothetical protein
VTSVKQNLPLVLGLAAAVAVGRILVRRRQPPAEPPDPRAAELRRRLAGARERSDVATAQPPRADQPPGIDASRRSVHERGRAALGEMARTSA